MCQATWQAPSLCSGGCIQPWDSPWLKCCLRSRNKPGRCEFCYSDFLSLARIRKPSLIQGSKTPIGPDGALGSLSPWAWTVPGEAYWSLSFHLPLSVWFPENMLFRKRAFSLPWLKRGLLLPPLLRPSVFWPWLAWQSLFLTIHNPDLAFCFCVCITTALSYELRHIENSYSLSLRENMNSK